MNILELIENCEVEWKSLGEIAEIYGGLTGKNKHDFEKGNAKYVSYKNIFDNIEVNPSILENVTVSENEKQHVVKYGDVLFTGSSETAEEAGMSSAVTTYFEENVYLNSFSFGIRFNDDIKIIPEFSKYLFRCHFIRSEIAKSASGVTRFNISKSRFRKIKIPIPPLEIQQKIVKILDKFTELEATLEATLEAELLLRVKQYNYYRDELLTFECRGELHSPDNSDDIDNGANVIRPYNVEWKSLGDLCLITDGDHQPPPKTSNGIPFITISNIDKQNNINFDNTRYVSVEYFNKLSKDRVPQKGDLLYTVVGTLGIPIRVQVDKPFVVQRHIAIIKPKKEILQEYLYYLVQTTKFFNNACVAATGAAQKTIGLKYLRNVKIPVPSLETQQKIVNILDKFDRLTNSISEGLPKEIALRQKQYEYYRERLLNFSR
ncbi:restriction endonuclease subunit S [Actinobacillus vicugnae]|uniref:restriction endonuclease subunit S n=1 Tax=Actinobacillus vicugnae TaxID=2573093 RepID=UPI0012407864|nr:restriction endonuclease subunit S [Actinobacillus vicugnae]